MNNFSIIPTDRVVDVGSGDHPFEMANVLVDLNPDDNKERGGAFVRLSGAKIVKADIHNLPFKDKEFDFVHCHDLLEHVDNPNKACSELIRIGKRGHIRTSTELFERLYGRPYHKWVCRYENNILIFKRKPKDFKENFGDFFDRLYRDNIEFKEITHRNMNLFFVEFEWKGKFEWKIEI